MNKAAIYISLFFGLFFLLSLGRTYNDYLEDSKGVAEKRSIKYVKLQKAQAVAWPMEDDVFVVHDSTAQKTRTYLVDTPPSSTQVSRICVNTTDLGAERPAQLMADAVRKQLVFQDTLYLMQEGREALLGQVNNFRGRRMLITNPGPFWLQLLDGPLIIFLLALLSLIFTRTLVKIANRLLKQETKHLFNLLGLLALLSFLQLGFISPWNIEKGTANFMWLFTSIFPLYFIYHWINKRYLAMKSTADRELGRFMIIFWGVMIFPILGIGIGSLLTHETLREAIAPTGFFHEGLSMFYLAFTLAAANLVYNLLHNALRWRSNEKELQQSQAQVLASEAELNALQASVNPHFLYNSLNSIASLAQVDPESTEKMALALSSFYQYTTNRKEEHLATVEQELEMLNNYLAIEKIRFGDRLIYEVDCAEAAKKAILPRFILQPLVENAIKYGYDAEKDKINIRIVIQQAGLQTKIQIFDNGVPFKENMSIGYGLRSVSKKLKLLFPNRSSLSYYNRPQKHALITIEQVTKA